ncbi:hypothetical protein [Shimia sp.]|uniref:hypothetical protein n=1 Tax=Shimia sp. TaxID=1954381 RepID=UPI003298AF57
MNRLLDGKLDVDAAARDLIRRANEKPDPIHTIVLSDESVSLRRTRDLARLARLRDHFDVKIMVLLRRQDLWLESWYFQNVKWQWNPALSHCTLDEFLAQRHSFHWLHYDKYIKRFEKLFGTENVEVAVFERDQMPGGPVQSFCRQIGLLNLEGLIEPKHTNASLSPAMSELIRQLPVDEGLGDETRHILTKVIQTVDNTLPEALSGGGKLILPHDTRREIMNEYAHGNQTLAQQRFGRDELFHDPLPNETTPIAKLALPEDGVTLMQHFFVPILSDLIRSGAIQRPGKKG